MVPLHGMARLFQLLSFTVVCHDFALGALVSDEAGTSPMRSAPARRDLTNAANTARGSLLARSSPAEVASWGDHGHGDPGHYQPFHCKVGLDNWQAEWSDGKKAWCCKFKHLGCPEHHTLVHEFFDGDIETIREGNQHEPFDCDEGLLNWQGGWSDTKKEWCCKFKGMFCKDHDHYVSQHNHNGDFHMASHSHNDGHAQTRWFDHFHVGSDVDGPAAPRAGGYHDCQAGLNNWQEGWAQPKKDYCCRHFKLACEPH